MFIQIIKKNKINRYSTENTGTTTHLKITTYNSTT
jgi:hypothetical protein